MDLSEEGENGEKEKRNQNSGGFTTPERVRSAQPVVTLTPSLPIHQRHLGKQKVYKLVRKKVKVTNEEYRVILGACQSLVGMEFLTKEKGKVTRWYCQLCTNPNYYDNLEKVGWGQKPS